jgi:hypothetical protein
LVTSLSAVARVRVGAATLMPDKRFFMMNSPGKIEVFDSRRKPGSFDARTSLAEAHR